MEQNINIQIHSFPKHTSIIKDIIEHKTRYNILCSSRQFGKTSIAIKLLLYWMLSEKKQKSLYVSPTYPLSRNSFKTIVNGLSNGIIEEANKSEMYIKFINGSEIYFKSATNDESIRGGSYTHVIVDEFSYISEETWNAAIRPTMNVTGKQALLVSTPRGKNLFHQMYQRGQQGEENYRSYRGHYTDNPLYDIKEVEDAKKVLPPNIFLQEYEGEFLNDFGSVFPNIDKLSILSGWLKHNSTGPYYAGLDLGRTSDYCVLTIMDSMGNTVEIFRENKQTWNILINKIVTILKTYNAKCIIEINGIGDPIFEQIKTLYKNVESFLTTNDSKNQIIEELILSMNSEEIKLPTKELFGHLHFEIDVFSFEYSKASRKIIYRAKQGFHDDIVMSLALCNHNRITKHFVGGFCIIK